jgi:hypothetical protein
VEAAVVLAILRFPRQSFVAVVGRAGTGSSLLCALCLLMALLVLVPFAAASPADPLWIAGIYDGADLDECIDAVTSMIGIVEGLPPGPCDSLALIHRIAPSCDTVLPPPAAPSPLSARAPPTV